MRGLVFWILMALPVTAQERPVGDFDYYVLALSWSPTWCALEGDARGSDQCDPRHDHGWILHGLWPQYESGYPASCNTSARAPSRALTGEMTDMMGTSGLAWHQWKKHGSCSGLSAQSYFDMSRAAYQSIQRPAVLRKLEEAVRMPASLVEEAFLVSNPQLRADGVTVTCRQGHIQEVRICLSEDLSPRRCGSDVSRDCTEERALFEPIR